MVKKLHHIARSGFSLLVALSIALPGVGFSAASTSQAWADAQARAVNDPPPTTLAEAKTNLDTANVLKSDAAAEEAAAKAALDAAKSTHTTASSNHDAATSAVNQATTNAASKIAEIVANAQAEYDAAEARVEETAAANTKAQKELNDAKSSLNEAQSAYEAAQQTYDELANSKDAELQAASEKLRQAEAAYDDAVTQYKEAFNDYKVANNERNEAQNALNAAKKKATECEAAVAAAQAKVNAAQKALDDAKAELSAAAEDDQKAALQAAVTAAQAELETVKGQKTEAEASLAAAKREISAAEQALITAQKAVDDAKANTGGVDIESLEKAVADARDEYEAAKESYETGAQNAGAHKSFQQALADKMAAEKAFNAASEKADAALKEYEAAQKELAAITAGDGGDSDSVLSVIEFFYDEASTDAINLFNTMSEASETSLGLSGDATDVVYVLRSLDLIENLNSFRTQIGSPEFRVTDSLMAYMAISLNYATAMDKGNSHLNSPREFIYFTEYSDYPTMNFPDNCFRQKEVWDAAVETNKFQDFRFVEHDLPENWSSMKPEQLFEEYPDLFYTVEIFANIASASNIYVGVAANHRLQASDTEENADLYGYGLSFFEAPLDESLAGESYTLTQWKDRFIPWILEKQKAELIATAATDEEIAALQQRVADLEQVYNDLCDERDDLESKLNDAKDQYDAAESVKAFEDAYAAATTKLANATQERDDAVAAAGNLDDPNHPLNVAVATAQADLQTKKDAADSIQNEITALEQTITQLQIKVSNAQTALDNYTAIDTTAQEVALAAAKRELETAQRELEAAQAEVVRLTGVLTELRNKCTRLSDKQENIRDNVMTPARQASDKAKSEFLEIAKLTQEESELRALYGAKNALDKQRDAYNKLVWNMPELESNADTAARGVATASDSLSAASEKLAAAKKLSLAGVMASPITPDDYSEFLVLNDHAQNVKEAQTLVPPAADKKNAAKADLDAKQAAYDAAHAKHLSATADRDEAQRIYDSFLGMNNDSGNKPGNKPGNTPGNASGDSGSSDPVVEPWNPGKPAGASGNGSSAGNVGDKGNAAGNGAAAAGEGQGDSAEAEATDEAVAEESSGYNAANVHVAKPKTVAAQQGLNPLVIAGIAAALVLAAGIAVLLVIRHRRNAAAAAAGAEGAEAAEVAEAADDSTTPTE